MPVFDAYASKVLAHQPPPGVALAAAADGKTVGEWSFGSRDAEAGLPVTADTVFGIASMAKPFTALAVLLLEERGAITVSDPVSKWLPEFRLPSGEARHTPAVTIHHLLTHTSGLPPEVVLPFARAGDMLRDPDLGRLDLSPRWRTRLAAMEARGEVIDTCDDLIARLARAEFTLLRPPGQVFSYSGEGYALLGALVERVSGCAFPDFVHEHVLDPLGMIGTGFRPGTFDRLARTHPVAQLYATGYATPARDGEKSAVASPAWWASGRIFGHANMVSTVQDLLRFAALLHGRGTIDGRRIAAPETIEKMLVPRAPIPTGGFYGYGLFVRPDYHGFTLVEHAGGGKGCAGLLALLLEPRISAAGLANGPTSAASRLTTGALNDLAGLPPDAPRQTFPQCTVDADTLARFAGTYRWNDDEEPISFELRGGALQATMSGQIYECRGYAPDGVVVCGPEFPLRILLNQDGNAWALSDGARISRRID
jgi:CubicO group peptidase (beta-lactamase class C family)